MTRPVTDAEILAAFAAAETAAGGPQKADTKAVLTSVAALLGVTYERARDAVLTDWSFRG